MGAVANDNRVELTVDSEVFHKAVRIIVDRDEILWLGFDPFSQIGMFRDRVGRPISEPAPPQNRTCGFPAYGSSERIKLQP